MHTSWPLLVFLLVPLVLECTEANKYVNNVELLEAGSLQDPFVYAASNQVDWSSRISPTTTPGPSAEKPLRKKATQNYQPSSSPSYPTPRKSFRKNKGTTTSAPKINRNIPQGSSYNTESYPGNQYTGSSSRYSPPQGNSPSTYGVSRTPSSYDSTPFSPPPRTSTLTLNRRKPVFSQSKPPIATYKPSYDEPTTPDYTVVRNMPLGGVANVQQYSTAFPKPQPQAQGKRVVIVRKTKPRQENAYGSTTPYNYPSPQASAGSQNANNNPALNPYTTIPTYPVMPPYDDEGFRFTDIRNRILEPTDELPSDSRHNSEHFFEPPKFEIPKDLDQKGCKMVIKEVQEVPKDLHARGSDLLESFFRSKRSPGDGRKAKTIIMTKECYFPDGTPSGSAQSHQFQDSSSGYREPARSTSNARSRSSKPYQASKTRPKYDRGSTESYGSSSRHYDYPNKRRQESTYDNGNQGYAHRDGNQHESQSSNRHRQRNTQAPKRQAKEGYSSRAPTNEGKYNQDRDDSTDSSYEGKDYHQGDPSQANYERSGFDDDYPGFSFETGFGGPEHEPKATKAASSSGGGKRSYGHGGQGSASGKVSHGHHSRPTPKMYQKTFAYYKKDDGKDNDPNNNSNAEEYASGYFKHFSTDYDSDRDGPQKKN